MTERPILFSAPMVRAILDGTKTQTRRVVRAANSLVNGSPPYTRANPEIIGAWPNLDFGDAFVDPGPSPGGNVGPYLQVAGGDDSRHRVYPRTWKGEQLWVRETWGGDDLCGVAYRADHPDWPRFQGDGEQPDGPWRPSIFMPRWASRITLEVVSVRVERLQDISVGDALREGVSPPCVLDNFQRLWDSINARRAGCGWADNPWVWAITFRRTDVTAAQGGTDGER